MTGDDDEDVDVENGNLDFLEELHSRRRNATLDVEFLLKRLCEQEKKVNMLTQSLMDLEAKYIELNQINDNSCVHIATLQAQAISSDQRIKYLEEQLDSKTISVHSLTSPNNPEYEDKFEKLLRFDKAFTIYCSLIDIVVNAMLSLLNQ